MLQITALFQNQNSRIYDALAHWKGNMDKQFEGIESCMICFSVVSKGDQKTGYCFLFKQSRNVRTKQSDLCNNWQYKCYQFQTNYTIAKSQLHPIYLSIFSLSHRYKDLRKCYQNQHAERAKRGSTVLAFTSGLVPVGNQHVPCVERHSSIQRGFVHALMSGKTARKCKIRWGTFYFVLWGVLIA